MRLPIIDASCSVCEELTNEDAIQQRLILDTLEGQCTTNSCGGPGRVVSSLNFRGKDYPVCEFCRDPLCLKCDRENPQNCQVCNKGYFLDSSKGCSKEEDVWSILYIASITTGLLLITFLILGMFFLRKPKRKMIRKKEKISLPRESDGKKFNKKQKMSQFL